MISVFKITGFWTLQLANSCILFPCSVTSPPLTMSSTRCGGCGALASAFMLTVSLVTNVPQDNLLTVTSARPRSVSEVNTDRFKQLMEAALLLSTIHGPDSFIGGLTTETTLTGTVSYIVMAAAVMFKLATATVVMFSFVKAAVASATEHMFYPKKDAKPGPLTTLLRLAIEAALARFALALSRVAAAALYLIIGVGLNIVEATAASVTKPTLDPRTDVKPQPFNAMLGVSIAGRTVPSIGYTTVALTTYFNTTAVLKPHTAATDSSSASYAAAVDQAGPLTQHYLVTSAA